MLADDFSENNWLKSHQQFSRAGHELNELPVVDYQLWSARGRHILTLAHHWASRNITQRHFSYTSCSTWQPPPHGEALLEFGPQRQGGVGEANTRFKTEHTLPAGMATRSHWWLCASGCTTFTWHGKSPEFDTTSHAHALLRPSGLQTFGRVLFDGMWDTIEHRR